jgi:hypothetical protein
MTEESEAFEKLNKRIARLVQGPGATVEWNVDIPDPDSPGEPRQIDVLIRTDDRRVIAVECRHRAGSQNVMWIEELVGRKLSLGLDAIIAVSVAGFTPLAAKKARRFGILLYDFELLSDQEIASWADRAEASFVQFDSLGIYAGVHHTAEPSLSQHPNFRFEDKDGYSIVMDRVRDDVLAHPGEQRTQRLVPAGFSIDGIPLTYLNCQYSGQAVAVRATCTAVSTVGASRSSATLRDITVQKFDHSVPEIIQHGNEAHLLIDASKLIPPPDAILDKFTITFAKVTTVTRYELIGARTMLTSASKVRLDVATTT